MIRRFINHPITVIGGLTGVGTSCIYFYQPFISWTNTESKRLNYEKKVINDILKNNKLEYNVKIVDNFEKKHRIYEYKVNELNKRNQDDLADKYHMDMMGYYKTEELLSRMLIDYLEKNEITQKNVILSVSNFRAHVTIENNKDDRYLILECLNNPFYEIKYDVLKKQIDNDIKFLNNLK